MCVCVRLFCLLAARKPSVSPPSPNAALTSGTPWPCHSRSRWGPGWSAHTSHRTGVHKHNSSSSSTTAAVRQQQYGRWTGAPCKMALRLCMHARNPQLRRVKFPRSTCTDRPLGVCPGWMLAGRTRPHLALVLDKGCEVWVCVWHRDRRCCCCVDLACWDGVDVTQVRLCAVAGDLQAAAAGGTGHRRAWAEGGGVHARALCMGMAHTPGWLLADGATAVVQQQQDAG